VIGERRLKSTVGEGSGYFRLSRLTLHNGYYGRPSRIGSKRDHRLNGLINGRTTPTETHAPVHLDLICEDALLKID